jgi:hypothetical protein
MKTFLGFLFLFTVSTFSSWGDTSGLMQPYSHQGSYPIADGRAKIIIDNDVHGHLQYQIIHFNRIGEGTGGTPDFIKNSSFFVFAEDVDHYWIYDGKSDMIHFVFSDQGMTQESFSRIPSHFRAMPHEVALLLPKNVREKL